MPNAPHHIMLVPGFFGFASFGELRYFHEVEAVLGPALTAHGVDARIEALAPPPTASLEARARFVADAVGDADGPVHLVGHSTGALDARRCARELAHVRSVVTISAPHRGAPLARMFEGGSGRRLLVLLSLAAVHVSRVGPLSLSLATQLLAAARMVDATPGLSRGATQQVFDTLLADFQPERRAVVRQFFNDVRQDTGLIEDLTRRGISRAEPFMAGERDVRAGCVLTRARKPGLESAVSQGLDPAAQLLHQLFRWLHARAGRGADVAEPTELQRRAMVDAWGDVPPATANDGIVPTGSQLWGEVIAAVWADHLDVMGHFHAPDRTPPHHDWLPSGSRFDRGGFERLWTAVADFIAAGC